MKSSGSFRSKAEVRQARRVLQRTRGEARGPVTRLVSPSALGQLIKPFVFLDYAEFDLTETMPFPLHPHSGIATLTAVVEGSLNFFDSNGEPRTLSAGDVEWMRAGRGVWHGGPVSSDGLVKAYQLWVALPPAVELARSYETFLQAQDVPTEGPAQLLLGHFNGKKNLTEESLPVTYLNVRLRAGETWRFEPSAGHDVLWIAAYSGSVFAGELVSEGEMVIFEPSDESVDFIAKEDCGFMLGSAVRSPLDVVEGYYSVHTSATALRQGEEEIRRLGVQLCEDGRLDAAQAEKVQRQIAAGNQPLAEA